MSFDSHTLKTKPRLLTVSKSIQGLPMILLSGAWFGRWGFNVGNRLSIYFVSAGCMLIKEEPDWEVDYRQQPLPPTTVLPILKNRKSHFLAISCSARNLPQVRITGVWLRTWGITIGDRVCVTREAYGILSIKLIMSAAEWNEVKKNKDMEREEAKTMSILEECRAKYPAVFDRVANKKQKCPATPISINPAKPSPADLIKKATREYNAAAAARSPDLFGGS